jgi:hypothetical protein
MKPRLNPVCKKGERNLYCLYYGDCLDHAVGHRWRHWNCSECSHKFTQEVVNAVRTVDDSNIFYELPPSFSAEVWHTFD